MRAIFDYILEGGDIWRCCFHDLSYRDITSIGVAAHSSSGSQLTTNLFKANELAGVTLVNSAENQLSMNTIQGSVNGIFADGQSTGNIIDSNNVLQNHGVDLNNGNGLPTNINNNVFTDNNCNTSVPDGLCLGR